jgi:hypothetical protein
VCPPAGAPWLRVTFAGDAFGAPLRARVIEQLGADLRRDDLALCEKTASTTGDTSADTTAAPVGGAPLADIALTLSPDAVLSLEVRDAVTDKRMTRDLPLASVPRDALALSITLAAEELLHASWIEAALAPPASAALSAAAAAAIARPKPVPPAVRAMNAETITRLSPGPEPEHATSTTMMAQAALLGAVERSTGGAAVAGQTDLGGDVRFSYGGRLAMSARFGIRAAPDVASVHGTVHGSELLAGLGLAYALVPRKASWGGELGVRADALDVMFLGRITNPSARGGESATGASGSALGAVVSGVVGGWARLGGPWRVVAETTLGAPVRAVAAIDAGTQATGVAGLSVGVALGIAATLSE